VIRRQALLLKNIVILILFHNSKQQGGKHPSILRSDRIQKFWQNRDEKQEGRIKHPMPIKAQNKRILLLVPTLLRTNQQVNPYRGSIND